MLYDIEHIGILYDISMAIGVDIDLENMVKYALSTYMQRLNCIAGGVFQVLKNESDDVSFNSIYSIPRRINNNKPYQKALETFINTKDKKKIEQFYETLPAKGSEDDLYFYIFSLPDFGLLVLVKKIELDIIELKSLLPLNKRFSDNCISCFNNQLYQSNLKLLNEELLEKSILLEKQNRALQISDKVKDEFLSNLSHELRTPLTVVYTYSEMMSRGGVKPEKVQKYSGMIFENAEKLNNYSPFRMIK